ncbi:phosphatase PAP2 family protein [Colwelliaceae bacterium 6441]
MKYLEILLFAVFIFLSVFFSSFDLWLTSQFWSPESGFYLKDSWWATTVYIIFRHMPNYLVPLLLVGMIFPYFIKRYKPIQKKANFLFLVLLIGPGVIVHLVFKENWDRPRPRDVVQFQGEKTFSPAFLIADQPGNNKSFISGHAAMGYFFISFAWLMRKRRYFWFGIIIGSVVSFGRIVQGGHFLTDVLTSGFVVYFTCQIVSYYLLGYSRIRPKKDATLSK